MTKPLLSICLQAYKSETRIKAVYNTLKAGLESEKIDFELVITDDCSSDKTFEISKQLEQETNNVRAFQLNKNCTSSISAFASLSMCQGDCAILIGDDEQAPIDCIVDLYRKWERNNKIVYLVRESREDPILTKCFSYIYYKIAKHFTFLEYPEGGIETVLIDREIIDILTRYIHPRNTDIIVEILRLNFNPVVIKYPRPKSKQKKSRWNFQKKLTLGFNIFFSSTNFPIKLITTIGFIFSSLAFITATYYFLYFLFTTAQDKSFLPEGWISIIVAITFFSGLILFSLGIIAEYIWRIHEEVKNRPGFIIKK